MTRRATLSAAGLAAAITVAALLLGGAGAKGSHTSRAPLGPEGVPVPAAPPLAPSGAPRPRQAVDAIPSTPLEQVGFHIHAHLTVFVAGRARQIPAGIGIAPPLQVQSTPRGAFVTGGAAFSWLHTHAADGVIHVESPVQRTYTLGQFFDLWGQPLARSRVGPSKGPVAAFVGGRPYHGDPRKIPLVAHAQIQLDVGHPLVAPTTVVFAGGL